jgi:mannobiose 2-epimerase
MKWALPLALLAAQLSAPARQPLPPEVANEMQRVLDDNIHKFWFPKSIDAKLGGYLLHFGPDGATKGDGPKGIVTQARMVWYFARMARAGHGDRSVNLRSADHGYKFLTTKMWDAAHGGFAWETDASGAVKTKPKKHMYGQSFALYAISEYALASGRRDVLDFAVKFFNLLEQKAHDSTYGGYIEFFNEDWTPSAEGSYMSLPGDLKLMNTHLHLMEAMTAFYRASKLPLARERLLELMTIESNTVVRKGLAACTDQYKRDWTPVLEGSGARVSYGHDLENIWLLADAAAAAGTPIAPLMDFFTANFAYSLKYGWDSKDGGFWYWGPFMAPAAGRTKSWWVQAEVLVCALTMYKLTGDERYREVFLKTWDFVRKHQIDWKNGEWWSDVNASLQGRGDKGGLWKAAYHNGRAMIECLALLKELEKAK